jgi:hypothetical protein
MKTRKIPDTDLEVSRLALDCMGLGGGWVADTKLTIDHERQAREILDGVFCISSLNGSIQDHPAKALSVPIQSSANSRTISSTSERKRRPVNNKSINAVPIPKLVCVTLSPLAGFIESHSRGNRSEVILNERIDLYENTVRHFNDAVYLA